MATRVGVGRSGCRESGSAGAEAAREAVRALAPREPDLVLVFATAGHVQDELLAGIRAVVGKAPISGCSGAGVIAHDGSDEGSRSVAVMALASDRVAFDALEARGLAADPAGCGRAIAAQVARRARARPQALLLFPDGLTVNGTRFLAAIEAGLREEGVPPLTVVGGSAGEMHNFDRTFQYHDGEVFSDGVSAVLLSGDFSHEVEVTHGCDPVGIEHVVTRSAGSRVEELDGRPAWAVLREYLDEPVDELNASNVPYLAVAQAMPPSHGYDGSDHVIRVPLGLDRETGAVFFPAELPVGERVIMARRNVDRICEAAVQAARRIVDRRPTRPAFVLQFDCAGRGHLLFGDAVTERLIAPVQDVIGRDVPWLGFHSYGEIAPIRGVPYFHNYTMALFAVYE